MSFHSRRRTFALGLFAAAILSGSGIALAAGVSIPFKVKGDYARAQRSACHRSKSFRLFHRHGTIEGRGFVQPAPPRHLAVRIELKRCVRGTWRFAGARGATTKLGTGKFKSFFSAAPLAPASHRRRAITYYYARAIAAGASSGKSYFAVTN